MRSNMLGSAQKNSMRRRQLVGSEYIPFHAPLSAYFTTLLMQWYIQIYFGLDRYSTPHGLRNKRASVGSGSPIYGQMFVLSQYSTSELYFGANESYGCPE